MSNLSTKLSARDDMHLEAPAQRFSRGKRSCAARAGQQLTAPRSGGPAAAVGVPRAHRPGLPLGLRGGAGPRRWPAPWRRA